MKTNIKLLLISVLCVFLICCSKKTYNPDWVYEIAPSSYNARFETSKGFFELQVTRSWSPLAADRLYQMLKLKFYDNTLIYRVVPNFVVQFGNMDTVITKKMETHKLADEPVLKSNLKGFVSYARAGKETRGNDLFINLRDNQRLDTVHVEGVVGYPVLGEITKGMDVVESFYAQYGNKTLEVYDSLSSNRPKFQQLFPMLDSIKRAYIIKN